MGPLRALQRAGRTIRRHRGRVGLLAGGVAIGVAMLVFLLSLVAGTRTAVLDRLVGTLPITHLTVTARSFSLSVLRFDSPFAALDERAVRRVEALPDVAAVLPMSALRLPAQLRASFFGQGFVTDTGVFGVETALVEDGLPDGVSFTADPNGDDPIPAVISSDLIEMYNTGFARANGLPQLTADILSGQDARLILGTSSFRPGAGAIRTVSVRLVGVSDRVPLVGVSLPRAVVDAWNSDLAGTKEPALLQLTVIAADAASTDRVAEQIESMGYSVTSGREIARRVRTIGGVLGAAFGLIGVVVLLVAGIGIANALLLSVLERRHEIGVFRAVGATRNDILLLFMVEATVIGAIGSGVGVVLAVVLARVVDRVLVSVLPDLPLLPASYFDLSWPILVTGLSLGVLVSILAAVSPAHRAARLEPARVLKTG